MRGGFECVGVQSFWTLVLSTKCISLYIRFKSLWLTPPIYTFFYSGAAGFGLGPKHQVFPAGGIQDHLQGEEKNENRWVWEVCIDLKVCIFPWLTVSEINPVWLSLASRNSEQYIAFKSYNRQELLSDILSKFLLGGKVIRGQLQKFQKTSETGN